MMIGPIETSSPPWLWERARREPRNFALGFGGIKRSFQELAIRAEDAAGRLVALGVRAGDRVALLMDASARMVELIHAVQRIGAVSVPFNTRLTAEEIRALVNITEPRILIFDREHAETAKAPGKCEQVESQDEFDAITPAGLPALGPIDLNAVHTIIFTSGTTGVPKGAMLTNRNHLASAIASRNNLGTGDRDLWLNFLPLYHVSGLSIILRSVIDGIPVTLHRGFEPHTVNEALRAERVTLFSAVATMLSRMLDDNGERRYPDYVRCVLLGGGPIPSALVERALRTGLPVAPTYGMTETASQISTAAIGEASRGSGGVGRPLQGTSVKIVNPDSGGRGEIAVRGPTVMSGFFRQPEATRAAVRSGWLLTGDIGHVDMEGYLYIDDRRGDLIVSGGENVYPAEVEAVLASHPEIAEAAVFAVGDPDWGHRVAAAIVRRDGAVIDQAHLRQWCEPRLAAFKIPRLVRFVDALPRTASGKVRRTVLRSRFDRGGNT
ncbi:MAG TPA: o-succinylbenzoate--CoA ligase [Candidatus Binataceae bacterium]|nr:o-succinylbenzoate--CoA ligase [Candidatus Binataceae bacterium]